MSNDESITHDECRMKAGDPGMDEPTDKARQVKAKESWYQAAVGTAIVAGFFSLFVLTVMVTSYVRSLRLDPGKSARMDQLRAALSDDRANEGLKDEIRALDLRLRKASFGATRLLNRGAWLLLGGLVVFVAAVKALVVLRRKLPMPQAALAGAGHGVRAAMEARRAIAAIAGLLAGAAAVLAISSGAGLSPGPPKVIEDSSYPSVEEMRKQWPRFRGPDGTGVAYASNVPIAWDGKTGQGILWKTQVPLPGHSSPIVWGDKLFVTGATKEKREVYCLDANSGKLLWQAAVEGIPGSSPEPPDMGKYTGSAASTMATDGERAFAIFANGDLAAFDFSGKRVWARSLGTPETNYGYATSLALWHNLLLIQIDQAYPEDMKSKLMAVNTRTGRTVWQTKRAAPSSWATPIAIPTPQGDQIITEANPWVTAYDAATGTELWKAECLSGEVAPSPTFANGLVYVAMAGGKLCPIRPDGTGDVTATKIPWEAVENLPDTVSPLTNGELVFLVTAQGLATCYDAKKGDKLWEHEFGVSFDASPTLVGDRVYLPSREGITYIFAAARQFKEIGKPDLGIASPKAKEADKASAREDDKGVKEHKAAKEVKAAKEAKPAAKGDKDEEANTEEVKASPAFLDGRIYIRTTKRIFCIGAQRK